MKYRELHRLLGQHGFVIARSSKHIIYTNGIVSVAVPHCKDVSVGSLRDILTTVMGDRAKAKQLMREVA